ncbi:hypothetical protein DVH05_016927 [Phytophthora capsici]|nr:hypothetical protein DVH05_016927 [Phytophthora capsici]
MAFQARWRELKKAGWHSKKPTGLSVDFAYLKPGKTKKDKRGEDFFIGEEELMRFLDKTDLAALQAQKTVVSSSNTRGKTTHQPMPSACVQEDVARSGGEVSSGDIADLPVAAIGAYELPALKRLLFYVYLFTIRPVLTKLSASTKKVSTAVSLSTYNIRVVY